MCGGGPPSGWPTYGHRSRHLGYIQIKHEREELVSAPCLTIRREKPNRRHHHRDETVCQGLLLLSSAPAPQTARDTPEQNGPINPLLPHSRSTFSTWCRTRRNSSHILRSLLLRQCDPGSRTFSPQIRTLFSRVTPARRIRNQVKRPVMSRVGCSSLRPVRKGVCSHVMS